jgi:hypothetical protein
MLTQKRFGRKVPLPSSMQIKRDLQEMHHAETLVEALGNFGVSKKDFRVMIAELLINKSISSNQARMLTIRYDPGTTGISVAK